MDKGLNSNCPAEIRKHEGQTMFSSNSNRSSDSLMGNRECGSERILNILNYRKYKMCSGFPDINGRSKIGERGKMKRNENDIINYNEAKSFNDFLYNNNYQTDTGGKCLLPTLSSNIKSKPSYLENISEEHDVSKRTSFIESGEELTTDVEESINSEPLNNTNNHQIENNSNVSNSSQIAVNGDIPKLHTSSFMDDQQFQEELFQQNLLAQQLLVKYFHEDVEKCGEANKKKENNTTKKAIALLRNVSSILRRFTQIADKSEQVSIKPSDKYMCLNDSRNQLRTDKTLRFIRPFRYHRNYSDSATNLYLGEPLGSCIRGERLCYGSDTNFLRDSLADAQKKSFENVQFLNTKLTHSNQNKVLYKNDSRNLEKNLSDEDFEGWNYPILSERYISLRNLFSNSYLESNRSRYHFQTVPRTSELVGLKFDNGVDFKVSDEEYKLWLKQNNFVKYTDYTFTTPSVSSSHKTSSAEQTNSSASQIPANLELVRFYGSSEERNNFEDRLFEEINYEELYHLIIYEHIVISNCFNFFSYYFFAKRLKKLSLSDRIYQLLFFIMCYYVMVILNESGITNIADSIRYRNVLK